MNNLIFIIGKALNIGNPSLLLERLRKILETYDKPGNHRPHPFEVKDSDYSLWYKFAETHESSGNRLRNFVCSLKNSNKFNDIQLRYLSEFSDFLYARLEKDLDTGGRQAAA